MFQRVQVPYTQGWLPEAIASRTARPEKVLLFASPDLINDDPTQFSTGIMHIDNDPNIDSTASFNYGKLTQWTLSLDAFNGQTIFVAFLHDSDDDFYLGLDDVVITQESTLPGVDELSNRVNVKVFPNPASDLIKVEFEASTRSNFDCLA